MLMIIPKYSITWAFLKGAQMDDQMMKRSSMSKTNHEKPGAQPPKAEGDLAAKYHGSRIWLARPRSPPSPHPYVVTSGLGQAAVRLFFKKKLN